MLFFGQTNGKNIIVHVYTQHPICMDCGCVQNLIIMYNLPHCQNKINKEPYEQLDQQYTQTEISKNLVFIGNLCF